MLEEIKHTQPVTYNILKNSIETDKLSHAYLFETNDYKKCEEIILQFCKEILSKDNKNVHIMNDIKNNIELKIINPDGFWIKKEQVKDLKQEFTKKAISGTKKIYIINHAERLNESASNSILKFLEDPEDNIIAILVTDNRYKLLKTIQSRCQTVALKFNIKTSNKDIEEENSENYELFKEEIIKFVIFLENNKLDTLLYTKKKWLNIYKEKNDVELALHLMILTYRDLINYKLTSRSMFIKKNNLIDELKEISIKKICKRIEIINEYAEKIHSNLNANLFIDKLIIDLEEGDI